MLDDQMHALQDQRLREALAVEMRGLRIRAAEAEAKEVQQQADLAALRAAAERARWCEERKADVTHHGYRNEWTVAWYQPHYRMVRDRDRDAAIDRAREEGK